MVVGSDEELIGKGKVDARSNEEELFFTVIVGQVKVIVIQAERYITKGLVSIGEFPAEAKVAAVVKSSDSGLG